MKSSNVLIIAAIAAAFIVLLGLGTLFILRALKHFGEKRPTNFKPLLNVQKKYDKIRRVTRIPCGVIYIMSSDDKSALSHRGGHSLAYSHLEDTVLASFDGRDDAVSRIKNGEFLVLTRMSESRLAAVIGQIKQETLLFSKTHPGEPSLTVNFGAYLIPAGNIDFEETVSRAKIACDEAKNCKRDYVAWDYNLQTDYENRVAVEKDLRGGVEGNNFFLEFQPVIDISSGNIVGGEVLTRLNANSRVLLPDDFIAAVKDRNMDAEFDFFVFEKTCRWISTRREVCKRIKCISVNFSRITLSEEGTGSKILEMLEKYGIEKTFVAVELLENIGENKYNTENIQKNLAQLKNAGIAILLDDFGDGYNSFDDLKNYSVDAIKISKAIVGNVSSQIGLRVFKSMINVAKNMGVVIICEGAETLEQIEILRDCGVVLVQGYYFYHSVSPDQFEKAIINNRIRQGDN